MKKLILLLVLILKTMTNSEAQVTTAQDLQSGEWTQVQNPEKLLSNTTWKITGLKLETQYKGKEVEPEKELQILVGTTWKFSTFAGTDSPENKVLINNKANAPYNIGMGSLYIEIPDQKPWQGTVFAKGDLLCYIHNGYQSDYFTCLITWKKSN